MPTWSDEILEKKIRSEGRPLPFLTPLVLWSTSLVFLCQLKTERISLKSQATVFNRRGEISGRGGAESLSSQLSGGRQICSHECSLAAMEDGCIGEHSEQGWMAERRQRAGALHVPMPTAGRWCARGTQHGAGP